MSDTNPIKIKVITSIIHKITSEKNELYKGRNKKINKSHKGN